MAAEARNGGYQLLTTDELASRQRQDPQGLLLVDVRQDWEYRGMPQSCYRQNLGGFLNAMRKSRYNVD